jgi:hypothetical protein
VRSLKAQLRGETLPEFTLTLPAGWERREPTDDTRDEMLRAARPRFMALHRPDLYAQFQPMVMRMFREMNRVDTVAFFIPGPDAPDDAYLPATLTASVRRGPHGQSLDAAVAELIRNQGATPLGEDKRILRWERESTETFDAVRIPTTTVAYFIPVPGTGRKRALQFTLVITHEPIDTDEDHEFMSRLKALFDAHVSTFAWIPA